MNTEQLSFQQLWPFVSNSKASRMSSKGPILPKAQFYRAKFSFPSNKYNLTSLSTKIFSFCYCFFNRRAKATSTFVVSKNTSLHFLTFKKTQKQSVALIYFNFTEILWGFRICNHFLQKVADLGAAGRNVLEGLSIYLVKIWKVAKTHNFGQLHLLQKHV